MLHSEKKERSRQFAIALRAGLPTFMLIGLLVYLFFVQKSQLELTLYSAYVALSVLFVIVYFNYFLFRKGTQESLIDATTHAYNKNAFIESITRNTPEAIVLIRIRNLETILSHHGYERYQKLLYDFARVLDNKLKLEGIEAPIIGRRGEGEFFISLDARERFVESFFKRFIAEHKIINEIEIAYGFAASIGQSANPREIYYNLNDNEEKRLCLSDSIQKSSDLHMIDKEILSALNEHRFSMQFRRLLPVVKYEKRIVDLSPRVQTKSQGVLTSSKYLTIINRMGLSEKYDLIILQEAIGYAKKLKEGQLLMCSISPFSLRNGLFREDFITMLKQSGVDPKRLVISLYEKRAFHNQEQFAYAIEELHRFGLKVCFDNFGLGGGASIDYISRLKFDYVRFDRDVTQGLNSSSSEVVVKSLIEACQKLDIKTIAKWVDTKEQKEHLEQLGIDYLQGRVVEASMLSWEQIEQKEELV